MKKACVWFMTMIMVMSTMSAVFSADGFPNSGGSGGVQRPAAAINYPFIFEDFEDEDLGRFPTTKFNTAHPVTCVKGGIDGSSKAALFQIGAAEYAELVFQAPATPNPGENLHYSAWIKTENTDLSKDKMSFIAYADATAYRTSDDESLPESKRVSGWIELAISDTGINKNGWTKVSGSIAWNGTISVRPTAGYNGATSNSDIIKISENITFTRISIRLYGTDSAAEDVSSVDYLVDDFEYYASSLKDAEGDSNIFTNSALDVNTSGWSMDGNSNYAIIKDAQDSAPDGSAGYLKIEPKTADSKIYGSVSRSATLKMNHLYKVSFWAKLIAAPEGVTTGGFWLVQYANKRIIDSNGITTNYPGYLKFNCLPLGEWKFFEFYYLNEYKASTQQQFTTVLRLFAGTDQNNSQLNVAYGLDNFRCEDLGSVANSDFSMGSGEVGRNNVQKSGQVGSVPTQYDVMGWNAEGANLSVVDREAAVSVTAEGGSIWQGVNVENDSFYKISFRAKATGESAGKPIAVKLDRTVDAEADCDIYEVPDVQYIVGTNDAVYDGNAYTPEVKAEQEWVLSDEWQTFEGYYNTAFTLKEGQEENVELIPRLPFMSFEVDGNKVGTSYMIDDVYLEKVSTKPMLSNLAVEGTAVPGEEISASYRYASAAGIPLGNMLVKVQVEGEQGYASIGSYLLGETFTIPEHAFNKDLCFELIPVDQEGYMGEKYHVEVAAPEGKWGKLFYNRKSMSVNAYYTEDADAEVIVATYSGNRLIGTEIGEISMTANQKATYELKTLTEEGADRLKVMLWNSAEGGKAMAESVDVDCTEPVEVDVFLLGDSLCANYATTSYPQQGWGYYLQEFFDAKANIRNYAVGGRTAVATYFELSAWPQVKSMADAGDYLILALGLNDSGSRVDNYEPELTDRPAKFKKYLNLICDEAQELGMTVIFNTLTPTIPQNNALASQNNWKNWCGYVEEVAEEQGCVCLDVNTPLRKLYYYDEELGQETEEMGDESYAKYFLSPEAMERFKEYPISDEMLNRAATYGDWTHVNEDGAWLIAETIADLLSESESPLKRYLK